MEAVLDAQVASLLMHGNMDRVFNETDPASRLAAMDDLWTSDPVMYEPGQMLVGRNAICANVSRLHQRLPAGTTFTPSGPVAGHHGLFILDWTAGAPGQSPHTFGTDIVLLKDGRIDRLYILTDHVA